MRPIQQKLPVDEGRSFVCRTYRTPDFETPWHQHVEYELVLMLEGHGNALVGDYFGEYQSGDVFLVGSNLPHWFRKAPAPPGHPEPVASSLVIQFTPDFLGGTFYELPEMRTIKNLFQRSRQGLKLTDDTQKQVGGWMHEMEHSSGLTPLWLLLCCFDAMARAPKLETLSSTATLQTALPDAGPMARVFEYTLNHFQEPISLDTVAGLVNMSRSTFCRRFKQSTTQTYVDFLKQVRIGHACKLLTETELSVLEICLSSGYNNTANFSQQFRELKRTTPLRYRFLNR